MIRGFAAWAALGVVGLGVAGWATPAHAQPVVASACVDDERTCQAAPLSFSRTNALPIEFGFDTGWVPPGSPLQVHAWGVLAAHTTVALSGALQTTWPDALTLEAPGDLDGGLLAYHYGIDVGAEVSISVDIAGQTYTWVGDIPYVPQVDFQVKADRVFDAWGYPPGVSATDVTMPVQLYAVDLVGLVTGIPGFEGGFALDASLELEVSYVTDQLAVRETKGAASGEMVAGGAFTAPDQQSYADYGGGPNVTYDVRPEGRVTYKGTLHLYPSLYVEILGNTQSIPLADIPIELPDTEEDWVFDDVTVEVPLPDIDATAEPVELGQVPLGDAAVIDVPVHNAGDMALYVTAAVEGDFAVSPLTEVVVMPGETVDLAVTFQPTTPGAQATPLLLTSNDPDTPMRAITLRGTGTDGMAVPPSPPDPVEPEPPATQPSTDADAGCGCEVAGAPAGPAPAGLAALSLAALAAITRRRRAAAASL